jgi:hypothetical protein
MWCLTAASLIFPTLVGVLDAGPSTSLLKVQRVQQVPQAQESYGVCFANGVPSGWNIG